MRRKRSDLPEYLIVDGYNMIGAWPILKKYTQYILDDARNKLQEMLVSLCGASGQTLVLVFDAHERTSSESTQFLTSKQDHRLIFTGNGQTADQFIERFVRENDQSIMTVASNDQLIQILTFSYANRISARELYLQVQLHQKEMDRIAQKRNEFAQRNLLEDAMDAKTRAKLEAIRRGKTLPK